MLTILIVFLLIWVIHISEGIKNKDILEGIIWGGFMSFICIMWFTLLFLIFICLPYNMNMSREWKLESETRIEIIQMADNNFPYGKFTLGSGTVENRPTYSFYYRCVNGEVRQKHIPVANIKLFTDSQQPYYIEQTFEGASKKSLWVLSWNKKRIKKEFHVPNNSIKHGVKLDLE